MVILHGCGFGCVIKSFIYSKTNFLTPRRGKLDFGLKYPGVLPTSQLPGSILSSGVKFCTFSPCPCVKPASVFIYTVHTGFYVM